MISSRRSLETAVDCTDFPESAAAPPLLDGGVSRADRPEG